MTGTAAPEREAPEVVCAGVAKTFPTPAGPLAALDTVEVTLAPGSVHQKLVWLGYTGSERTTRRAVAAAKTAFRVGNRRVHRPWVTEPGMWLQYDYGDGPLIDGVKTVLFVAWVAWSRFRVVLPLRDKTLPSVFAALDVTFRRIGGVPTCVLTDNEKTVTSEHIAGIPVRNQQLVAFARHCAVTVHTCVPADPASKGGTESSVGLRPGSWTRLWLITPRLAA